MEIDSYLIICPYCGHAIDGYDEFEGDEEGESKEIECEECNKKFHARKVITIDYRTESDCELNGEKHEEGKYQCKKCDIYNCSTKSEGKE